MTTAFSRQLRRGVQVFTRGFALEDFTPLQCALGLLLMLLLAAVGTAFDMKLSTASLLNLLLVVSFAVHCGFLQASILSFAAVLCQTYFFTPPVYTFHVADPRNLVAILIFEATALIVSQLSAREKAHALESRRQRIKLQRLYSVSRGAMMLDQSELIEQQLAELILREFALDAVAIRDATYDTVGLAGAWGTDRENLCEQLRMGDETALVLPERTQQAEICTSTGRFGKLILRGEMSELGLESLASLVALTLERHHAFLKEGDAEAGRRTEQLRTTVLDGLAHAFKTPLTIIRAASTGLLELGNLSELQRDLTGMIDEESAWLDDLATRLLQTARLEGEDICLQLAPVDVSALLHEVVADFEQDWTRGVRKDGIASPIHISLREQIAPISADHDMLRSTLSELLENAVKYSSAGKPIFLQAERQENELLLSVHSWGAVIQMEDRERIFERFYRCREHQNMAPGTGIGLSVARRTAEAHLGNIWVTSSELEGTTFNISIPIQLATMEPEDRRKIWQLRS